MQFSNIIIPNPKIRLAVQKEIECTGYDEPNVIGIVAAIAAYSEGEKWFEEAKSYIQKNMEFTKHFLKEKLPKVQVMDSEGTYLLWLDFSALGLSDSEIDDIIVNKAKVWLDRGTMFGEEGEYFQRINVATPRPILEKALDRIAMAFQEK